MDYGKMFVDAMLEWDFPAAHSSDSAEKTELYKKSFDNIRLEAAICDKDRYSFVFAGLRMNSLAGALSNRRLLSSANQLISKVDYLTERLALIELDEQNGVAQIRSSKPVQQKNSFDYFEILISNENTCSMHRYRKSAGEAERQRIPVLMTSDTLARLIDDMISLWQAE